MIEIGYIEDSGDHLFKNHTSSEDKILIKDKLFGVFDGASSLVKYTDKNGKTGGFLAAEILNDYFEKNNGNLVDLTLSANMRLREEMEKQEINTEDRLNLWSSTIAVVRLNEMNFEWAQICDSYILVIYQDNSFKLISKVRDHDRPSLVMLKEHALKKEKNIREKIMDQIIKVRRDANVTYGVLNGDENAKKFLESDTETLNNVKHILLFTDGFLIPKEDPTSDDDFETFVKLYLEGGLQAIKDYVRKLEENDPDCWVYPRFKQHDDIAAIAITL